MKISKGLTFYESERLLVFRQAQCPHIIHDNYDQ
jgi:hypothetical protein